MTEQLPVILSAGIFESDCKFEAQTRSPMRLVTDYELELHLGQTHGSWCNGSLWDTSHGSILFAVPGDRRWSRLPFRCRYVRFSQQGGQLHDMLSRLGGVTRMENPEELEAYFERIRQCFLLDSPQARVEAVGQLLILLAKLEEACARQQSREFSQDAERLLLDARRYIDANYAQELTVEQLAKACHVSPSYLHRVFSAANTSPHRELLSRRICAAKQELIETKDPVSQIAWRCGFSSPAYFSDCFKQATGVSPAAFRKLSAYPLEST